MVLLLIFSEQQDNAVGLLINAIALLVEGLCPARLVFRVAVWDKQALYTARITILTTRRFGSSQTRRAGAHVDGQFGATQDILALGQNDITAQNNHFFCHVDRGR